MKTVAIIVAAGRGERAGGDLPKQFQPLGETTVLGATLQAFAGHPQINDAVLVLHPEDRKLFDISVRDVVGLEITIVAGGARRDSSVRAGLDAVPDDTDAVLIHDAARPLVSNQVIDGVLGALQSHDAAAPALPIVDALWTGEDGRVTGLQPRDGLYRAQTPQGFRLAAIRAAHAAHPGEAADDVTVALTLGLDVAIVDGDEANLKITHPGDFARAEAMQAAQRRHAMDVRTGNGFDVHRFGPGVAVTLCGVEVPHSHGLVGHSDADVGMHAVTDAIYGALADGDIGQHFPPSDPQWKGAPSHVFLKHAVARARDRGYAITHADCTLICETPKIGPHATDMRRALAALLGIAKDRVSVKATTSERLGFTGRSEGIAAMATVTLIRR